MGLILGIDPGSRCTGYGLVAREGQRVVYHSSGAIVLPTNQTRYEKLRAIYLGIDRVIQQHAPTHFAVEDVFHHKNPRSSLVLGEARGVAILAASLAQIPVFEYSPREIKLSVTGNGAAHKSQVNFMLGKLLSVDPPENEDESDALAVALCHAFKSQEWSRV